MNEMATDARLAPEAAATRGPASPPVADVRRSRGISLVWLVPLVAAVIAGWLAWTTYARQGPTIRLYFETADGLEAEKTQIRYREVNVGRVERIQIGQDLRRVVVTVRLVEGGERFAAEGSRYWIVRPRVGAGGVSGLGTLVSGAYIEVDPGAGEDQAREFTGLEEPPQIRSNVPGREFTLRADTLGSVARGSPVYYRGLEVGQVLGYELLQRDSDALQISVFVRSPYDDLVHQQTRFWNASGLSVGTDGGGLSVRLASIQSLLVGGIEFETPPGAATETPPAPAGTEFYLFPDVDAADREVYSRRETYLVEFEGSARGLARHAAVEVRGIRVGTVDDVRLAYDAGRGQFAIQAVVQVAPERIQAVDAGTGQQAPQAAVEALVGRGLRAQLKTGNLLTGDLFVDLDFYPGQAAAAPPMRQVGGLKVIPSVPTQLETLQASATELVQKFAALPLADLVRSLNNTAAGLERMVGSEETQAAVAGLAQTLASLRETLAGLNAQAGPVGESLKASADAATATLRQAEGTFSSLQRALGPNSRLERDLGQTLEQLSEAARSVRALSDYLERNPQALIRGKRGGYE